jgi:hypothetical protein
MPKETLFKNINNNYIETGAYEGYSIQLAIDSGFTKIISIELSTYYADICRERFTNNKEVEIVVGDSFFELEKILQKHPTDNFTYWLDGHYSGVVHSGYGVKEYPIMEELETILKRDVKEEVIYVDDMRLLENYSADINSNKIIETILKYKPNAILDYEGDSLYEKDVLIVQY